MGKGDRKTAKGKRSISSYGNVRPHTVDVAVEALTKSASEKKTPVKTVTKKTVAKRVLSKAGAGRG